MSKRKLLAKGVLFGYGAIGAQMFYSFASIPLALSHLSKAEFGMWSLVTTLVGYLMLTEMGITNAVTRHLLECKEGRDPGKYGRIFTGSVIALGLVALAIAASGILISLFAVRLFPVPEELTTRFIHVMIGQSLLMAINMATQMIGIPLYVHHRQDIGQINQIGLFVVYFVVLHFAFQAGWGIYSMLANQAAGILWGMTFTFISCKRLRFYPRKGTWALPSRDEWRSVWSYSRDVFAVQIGGLILTSIPQLTIARLLGLEAGATWAVATRPFTILRQVVGRPFDVALPVIYDAYIRNDMKAVTTRWAQVTQVVLAVSGVFFAVAAANNTKFLELWTSGRIHWPESNQWFLALYFYAVTMAGMAFGAIGIDKSIGKSRFVSLAQAGVTILLALTLTRVLGVPGLMLALTLPYIPGMIIFGVRYLGSITGFAPGPLAWKALIRPSLGVPFAALAAWACSQMSDWLPSFYGLFLSAASGTLLAMGLMMFIGVTPEVRNQIFSFVWKILGRLHGKRPAEA